jgi:hypothetical protein
MIWVATVHCHPSPFLRELPPELVEDASARAKQPVSPEAGKDMFAAIRRRGRGRRSAPSLPGTCHAR